MKISLKRIIYFISNVLLIKVIFEFFVLKCTFRKNKGKYFFTIKFKYESNFKIN